MDKDTIIEYFNTLEVQRKKVWEKLQEKTREMVDTEQEFKELSDKSVQTAIFGVKTLGIAPDQFGYTEEDFESDVETIPGLAYRTYKE